MPNSYLKTLTLPSGSQYYLWDTDAHQEISAIKEAMTSVFTWMGVTTTALTDGATTNPIVIGGQSITAKTGYVVQYGSNEFVFNGTSWQLFGEAGAFGSLAFKNSASGNYTPAGSVSQPTFTGSQATVSLDYTPSGSISKPTFTGTSGTLSTKYTPAGSVTAPTLDVKLKTTTVNSITNVGTLPSLSFTVSGEDLKIDWSAGTLPTKGSNTTVATSVSSATATAPTFSGSESTLSVNYTPSGSISKPTFTGTSDTISTTITPAGTVSKPSFTGTAATITVS